MKNSSALILCLVMFTSVNGFADKASAQATEQAEQPTTAPPAVQEELSSEERLQRGRQRARAVQDAMGIPNLTKALEQSPGMLKAVSGRMADGKLVIFGWFENKEAVQAWYYGDLHQKMLDRFAYERPRDRVALGNVADDIPIMVMASFTPPKKPGEGFNQISIEVYTPVNAGFTQGGSLGPEEIGKKYNYFWKDLEPEEDDAEEETVH